jgi:hypothetical protein
VGRQPGRRHRDEDHALSSYPDEIMEDLAERLQAIDTKLVQIKDYL